jgi:uncharacterized protein (DUF58 family)
MLGFAAVNTGNNLLYLMVSALLGFMAVSGLLGQQNLQRLAVEVLPEEDLFAHLPAKISVQLHNRRRWLPAFLLQIEIGAGHRLYPVVPAGDKMKLSLPLTLAERGYQDVPEIWIRSCFPINFFIRSRKIVNPSQFLVFPQPQSVTIPLSQAEGRHERRQELIQPGNDGELRNIDNYQASDPLKSIHWKLSARHDDYKVKRLNRLGAPAVILNLTDFSGSLEQRLAQCTFTINQMTRQQQAVGLQLDELHIAPTAGRNQQIKLLTELALYGRR